MTPITRVVAVPGTWAAKGGWWQEDSPFWSYMSGHHVIPALVGGVPFEWETHLGSSAFFWRHWGWGDKAVTGWKYAGKALAYYLDALKPEDRIVIAHSHGGQVALHCAALGVRIERLVTVATPYRRDMQDVIADARPSIREWVHVSDLNGDRVAFWGRFGDGKLGGGYRLDQADWNYRIAGIGHSGLLSDESQFHHWRDQALIEFLRGEHQTEAA